MNSIALIAPYEAMAEIAKEICEEFEKPITIEVGDLQEGLKKARLLVEKGIEVIISRGGTAKLLKNELAIPVVEIQVPAYDILEIFRKIPNKSQKIGIIGFGNVIYGSRKLGEILDLDLVILTISKEEEVSQKIGEATEKKVGIIIGDKVVVSHAKELGYPSILIESGRESILQSFHDAHKILEVVRSEQGAKNELERKVKERTAELVKVNELSHEIEEQKQTEEALRKSEELASRLAEENAIMAEIGRIISSTLNIEEVYKLFSERVRELIPSDRVVINLIDFKENTVTVPYVEGIFIPGRQSGDLLPLAGSVTERILKTPKGFILQMEDESEMSVKIPGFLPEFRSGLRSALTVPLISRDQVIGALALRSMKSGAYTDRDLRLAENIANQIAGAIANAQLFLEREKLIQELQDALAKIKALRGLIPICASCKKIRDDKGYWGQIEVYIRDHSEAEFTHGICPECLKKLYPGRYPDDT